MKKILKDQSETITREIAKTGSCCSSSGCGSETISILSETIRSAIKSTSGDITLANRFDHLMARIGVKREQHSVEPGLYALGKPQKSRPFL